MARATLSPATAEQAEAINRVIVAAKSSWDYDEAYLRAAIPVVRIDGAYLADNVCVVARWATEIIGFGAVELHAGDPGVLEHLWVEPASQRQGVGADLLQSLCHAARRAGCRSLMIASDPPAVGFYMKQGATIIGEVPSRVPGGPRFPVLELVLEVRE